MGRKRAEAWQGDTALGRWRCLSAAQEPKQRAGAKAPANSPWWREGVKRTVRRRSACFPLPMSYHLTYFPRHRSVTSFVSSVFGNSLRLLWLSSPELLVLDIRFSHAASSHVPRGLNLTLPADSPSCHWAWSWLGPVTTFWKHFCS